ncbi:VOC family protein [Caldinitratiruptor microaerophilus]|uniref:VOC domain-containing protein n=1 Tax=Caldinitratiruptor microaerophilus TaxID=671077 RepID=A0AA35CL26_9FIRM|nr:VOC family protein [Caldinitratiruptor microaerophilus]BDG60388.1 hypothetical protein caldi_14780 [Caldinitratiruptor microaerophilus]
MAPARTWVVATPKLLLVTPQGQENRIGTFSNVIFLRDDMERTYAELTARGVEFPTPPQRAPWGKWWATFRDPDGNEYGLALASEAWGRGPARQPAGPSPASICVLNGGRRFWLAEAGREEEGPAILSSQPPWGAVGLSTASSLLAPSAVIGYYIYEVYI